MVDPEILYRNYLYRSSISRTFTAHCYDIAQHAVDRFKLKQTDMVLDIASNDGIPLGVLYRDTTRPTLDQRIDEVSEKVRAKSLTSMLDSYAI